ncbi:MAG: NAD(P)/FAD-dependent oxidoreductase [Candidatus Aenigmarchaeota archaeon]|nr:NAD(P)/FAD-dependent oxidoreductase [Candidatus Aenigmarchaeota archaeon]
MPEINERPKGVSDASEYDVIVIGAGPAGTVAAMYLADAGANILLIDKESFPRDKICGDAQGRKAAGIMKELGIYGEYERLPGQKIYGITLSSPNGTVVELDVEKRNKPAPGYCHTRIVFDNFLFQSAKKRCKTRVFNVTDLLIENSFVRGIIGINEKGDQEEIRAKMILGADGGNSVVARKFNLNTNPPEHFIVAIRAYYKNVEGMTDRIEIHMIKSLIPGYFWIFPLPNGEANVGLGMIVKDKNEKKVNLKEALLHEIKNNPLFIPRFKDAKLLDEIRGWNLPVASYHRRCFGNGFMLLGDAASLIDPLSGEGVGNAMISGKVAAKTALEALKKNDFSERFLKRYDKELWSEIGDEIKTNYRLQKLGKRFPHLIDVLLMKAKADESMRKKIEELLPYTGGRKKIGSFEFLKFLGLSWSTKDYEDHEEELKAETGG